MKELTKKQKLEFISWARTKIIKRESLPFLCDLIKDFVCRKRKWCDVNLTEEEITQVFPEFFELRKRQKKKSVPGESWWGPIAITPRLNYLNKLEKYLKQ